MDDLVNREVAQQKPSLPRRFGGHFLGLLGLREAVPNMTVKERAVDRENQVLDQRQQAHLRANLFREVGPSTPENTDRHIVMQNHFIEELAGRDTIAERFALFRQPFYAPFVSTLDIGETKRPDSHDDVEVLKQEYHLLLQQLIEQRLITGELPRSKAKPTIHLSFNSEGGYVSANRNRDLFSFPDGLRTLSVAKRMTFLMPQELVKTFPVPSHGRLSVAEVIKVEKLIDAQDSEAIIPVRTVYYAKSKPIEKSED